MTQGRLYYHFVVDGHICDEAINEFKNSAYNIATSHAFVSTSVTGC